MNLAAMLRRLKGARKRCGPTCPHGACYKCERCWGVVGYDNIHSTMYENSRGCFPLCQSCWKSLTPDARLPYYRRLWALWISQGSTEKEASWEHIEHAVLEGK
jgi:hypothetical protein